MFEVDSPLAATLARDSARRHGDRPALRHLVDGAWRDLSFTALGARVDQLATGLLSAGVQKGDRLCILAETGVGWVEVMLAVHRVGAVVVPIYPSSSPKECAWVAGDSQARMVFCDSTDQVAKIESVRSDLPALERVFAFEALDAVREMPDADRLDERSAAVVPDDPCLIIYTSGTTGRPKGCVLTHRGVAMGNEIVVALDLITPDDVGYLYLPLAHIFAQLMVAQAMTIGCVTVLYGGDTRRIVEEIGQVKPTLLPSVPRIFEKIHAAAMAMVPDADRAGFDGAVALGVRVREALEAGEPVGPDRQERFAELDERIFQHVRALFGGSVRLALSSAAPLAPDVLRFFYASGVTVMESYGMTESTGLATANRPGAMRFGSAGPPLPGVEVRIADDGEILLNGPMLLAGYWRNPDATAEALTRDGWLRTGDLGRLDEDGFLFITGRKKDIIITAGGKNLTPANLESDLKQSRWISQAVMYGDRRPYPVALLTLDEETIVPWAEERGLSTAVTDLADHPDVLALLQGELDGANGRYAPVEQIKRFAVLDHDLTQEAGEITPTMKLKRNVVYDRYAGVFDGLYA